MAVEADDVGQNLLCKQRDTGSFLFQDNLQQNTAGQIITRFGIQHHKGLRVHHQIFDLCQCDVGRGIGVVKPAIGIFFDNP